MRSSETDRLVDQILPHLVRVLVTRVHFSIRVGLRGVSDKKLSTCIKPSKSRNPNIFEEWVELISSSSVDILVHTSSNSQDVKDGSNAASRNIYISEKHIEVNSYKSN